MRGNETLRPLAAEAIGTMLLVAGVVGSGIMAQRLTHDTALALMCNTVATGAILAVLILVFAPLSGAHFNPAVSLAFALRRRIAPRRAAFYVLAQTGGAVAGTVLAHMMFGLAIIGEGATVRSGGAIWLAEGVATTGLLLTIFGTETQGAPVSAAAVGLYIAAAYWFTASTSFANPAVTVARALTPSFAGIRPVDAPFFVGVELAAAILATPFLAWLFRR
jgi:glycerol uptake facilitator-like aquaporin